MDMDFNAFALSKKKDLRVIELCIHAGKQSFLIKLSFFVVGDEMGLGACGLKEIPVFDSS